MKSTASIILLVLLTVSSIAQTQCTLKGEIINRDSKTLLIRKGSESFRLFIKSPARISIENGKFNYTLSYTESEAYELIFEDELEKGNRVPITFFPTGGVVEFKLHPQDEWEKNTIRGGALNAEYEAFRATNKKLFDKRRNELLKIQNDLSEKDEYNSAEYKALIQKLKAANPDDYDAKVPIYQKMDEMQKTHARYTEKAKQLFVDPYDSLAKAELLTKYEYIKDNTSQLSYYFIWKDVEMSMKNNSLIAQLVTGVFPIYEKKYPGHVYTKLVGTQVAGLRTINVGGKYVDFKAPSIEGDTVQLSTVIQDHIALLDLWGSWCGPCIAKSRLVVPIYNQYKDKGFRIVGIAREFKNTDALKSRLNKEQFSWLNLVELDDRQNIWNLYGISNGTGLMVLVDKDGTILSIDPKPEELENMLRQKLQ